MSRCKANPCCGDPYDCEVPLPQDRTGLYHLNERRKDTTETERSGDVRVTNEMVERAQDAWIKTRLKSSENHKASMRAALEAALTTTQHPPSDTSQKAQTSASETVEDEAVAWISKGAYLALYDQLSFERGEERRRAERAEAALAEAEKALNESGKALDLAAGTALGVNMSGSDHPDPDGALMGIFEECQATRKTVNTSLATIRANIRSGENG